jgi:putative transposase
MRNKEPPDKINDVKIKTHKLVYDWWTPSVNLMSQHLNFPSVDDTKVPKNIFNIDIDCLKMKHKNSHDHKKFPIVFKKITDTKIEHEDAKKYLLKELKSSNKLMNNIAKKSDELDVQLSVNKKDDEIYEMYKMLHLLEKRIEKKLTHSVEELNEQKRCINEKNVELLKRIDEVKKEMTKIRSQITEIESKIYKTGKTTVTKKYKLNLDKEQQIKVKSWSNECTKLYNFCVCQYNKQKEEFKKSKLLEKDATEGETKDATEGETKEAKGEAKGETKGETKGEIKEEIKKEIKDETKGETKKESKGEKTNNLKYPNYNHMDESINFHSSYTSIKVKIFNHIYGDNEKSAPYAILTDVVAKFCANLKSCSSNKKNQNISDYVMHEIAENGHTSIYIPKSAIKENGIYVSLLKKIKMDNNIDFDKLCDSRLLIDLVNNTYTLMIPTYKSIKVIKEREPVVALDPGEKIFMAFYGINDYGCIGNDVRKKILFLRDKIGKLDKSIANKKNNKTGDKISKKGIEILKKRRYNLFQKTKNIIKEMHNKTASYLCKNYDRILLPEFKTHGMVKREAIKSCDLLKGEMIARSKRGRLAKNIKYSLMMQSHYKFQQHLTQKCEEKGCEIVIVTEEYTTQACTKCGELSSNCQNRIKTCTSCGMKMNRDLNGARNILLKNICKVI